MVGGGWWANPLQTLSQGLVLTFSRLALSLTIGTFNQHVIYNRIIRILFLNNKRKSFFSWISLLHQSQRYVRRQLCIWINAPRHNEDMRSSHEYIQKQALGEPRWNFINCQAQAQVFLRLSQTLSGSFSGSLSLSGSLNLSLAFSLWLSLSGSLWWLSLDHYCMTSNHV